MGDPPAHTRPADTRQWWRAFSLVGLASISTAPKLLSQHAVTLGPLRACSSMIKGGYRASSVAGRSRFGPVLATRTVVPASTISRSIFRQPSGVPSRSRYRTTVPAGLLRQQGLPTHVPAAGALLLNTRPLPS